MTTIEEYYGSFKRKLASKGVEGICLDIDDTLSATNFFWAQNHMRNFGNPEGLTAEEIIRKYRYVSNVPYWGNNECAEEWILQNCQSNEGRLHVSPVDGAVEAVERIGKATTLIAYLTGRTEQVVEGTRHWLDQYEFPKLEILTQPSQETLEDMCLSHAHEWKARVLEFLYPEVTGIVEDNIGLIGALSEQYEGRVYLYSHNGSIDASFDVVCCPTWIDIVRAIEQDKIKSSYDRDATDFLVTRTEGRSLLGFGHREIEQPYMFGSVPTDLRNKKLLDLGCGPGIHAKEYVKRGAEVIGVDLSEEMIRLAREYCPDGKFRKSDAYQLPFQNSSFDIVTSSLLLDHVDDLSKVVDEVGRVLKDNGLFVFSVPNPIINLFEENERLKVGKSYFDKNPRYFSIAGNQCDIVAYPHQLMEYFQVPVRKGFILLDFVENEPKKEWLDRYNGLDQHYFMIPQLCVFKWMKK
jgi:ubiquinone/menaquinone biosynthesis C-methylase UbiE